MRSGESEPLSRSQSWESENFFTSKESELNILTDSDSFFTDSDSFNIKSRSRESENSWESESGVGKFKESESGVAEIF